MISIEPGCYFIKSVKTWREKKSFSNIRRRESKQIDRDKTNQLKMARGGERERDIYIYSEGRREERWGEGGETKTTIQTHSRDARIDFNWLKNQRKWSRVKIYARAMKIIALKKPRCPCQSGISKRRIFSVFLIFPWPRVV